VETLAQACGLSRAHFFRLFEQATGATPHIFLNGIRVEGAVDNILQTNDGCAKISKSLGFSKPAHFTRFFRNHVGIPPTEFRKIAQLGSSELNTDAVALFGTAAQSGSRRSQRLQSAGR
jgi:AraC family transcriptional regulator